MLHYMVSEYSATGEGMTISMMITRAYPQKEDYEVHPTFEKTEDGHLEYIPGVLNKTEKEIVTRKFLEEFGYMGMGIEHLTEEDFFANQRWQSYVPEVVKNMTDPNRYADEPGNLHWYQQSHVNFS